MSKAWDYNEARGMRAQGESWDEIGRVFGVSSHTAHMRTDPKYAAYRREQINARRRLDYSSTGKRERIVKHPIPVVQVERRAGPFVTSSGILAYDFRGVSLPYVSILDSTA